MKKALMLVVLVSFALALALASCATIEKGEIALKTWWAKEQPKVAAFIDAAQKALKGIQKDYAFFASALTAGAKFMGYDLSADDLEKIRAYVAMADTDLSIVGAAVENRPLEAGQLENALASTSSTLPVLKKAALAAPTVSAIYNAWLAAEAAKAAPAPAK